MLCHPEKRWPYYFAHNFASWFVMSVLDRTDSEHVTRTVLTVTRTVLTVKVTYSESNRSKCITYSNLQRTRQNIFIQPLMKRLLQFRITVYPCCKFCSMYIHYMYMNITYILYSVKGLIRFQDTNSKKIWTSRSEKVQVLGHASYIWTLVLPINKGSKSIGFRYGYDSKQILDTLCS